MNTDADVKVGVDTSEAQKNLKQLEKASRDAKNELSSFDKVVGTAFGSKNVFQVTNFNRALSYMVDTIKTVSIVMVGANIAIMGFFGAIVKELNKLQGFLSIMTLSAKSAEDAGKQFDFLRGTANKLGIDLNSITNNYAKLVAAIPEGNEKFAIAQKLFTGLAMAARTLHASTLDTQLMFYAVTQMASKGVISMEELRRQLGERLPGAMEIAARSLNTTTSALEKAIRTGTVQSAPFLKYFGDELIRTFAASADIAANTVDAALNRLRNVWVDFVKNVLDSGAGNAIVRVFDELREKLSDPGVMAMFSTMIGDLATKVADFVKLMTAEDIARGFATMRAGIEGVVAVTLKMIEALSWIINNSTAVGAVVGGLFGAAKGAATGFMLGGPKGALIGAGIGGVAGMAGGGYAGSQVNLNPEEATRMQKLQADAAEKTAEAQRQTGVMLQSIMGTLKALGFSSTDMSHILPMIERQMGFNVNTAGQFASLIYDKQFSSLQHRQAAALTLSSTGAMLGPRGSLEDVLGAGKGDKDKKARRTPTLPKVDELKEGLQYIEMLERMLAREEQLTEVEKLWRAAAEGRVKFNSEENFLRAKSIALKIDEANATQALEKANNSVTDSYRDQMQKIQEVFDEGLTPPSQRQKGGLLQAFDNAMMSALQRIPDIFADAKTEASKLAAVLRAELVTAIDAVIESTRTWEYGWLKAITEYVDLATDGAKQAENIFTSSVQAMEDAFVQFVTTGKFNIRDLANTFMAEFSRMIFKQGMAALITKIGGAIVGGGASGGYDVGTYTGGAEWRATGGRAQRGMPYWVGERGKRELFVPDSNGQVYPDHKVGGSQVSISFRPDIRIDARSDQAQVYALVDGAMRESEARMYDSMRRGGLMYGGGA